jgi:hypothetical protein
MQRYTCFTLISGIIATHSAALATMTPTFERGEKTTYFSSPRGVQEVCIIPKKYPGAKYQKKDLKKEQELCNYSFYPTTAADDAAGKKTVALCAKTNSTNPGVNIFEIPDQQTKLELEKKGCEGAEKIGKYKNSTSCSYAPSIVGYYHLSRILGGIGNVPVSVLRSMDIETHKALAAKGVNGTTAKGDELIHTTWSGLNSILNQGLNSSRKDLVLSDDGQQSYGAFIVNPKKEEFFKDLFTPGPDRAIAFRDKNVFFQLVRNPSPLNTFVSHEWKQENVQKLYTMRDVTEFILLDHILDQQDRFGNTAEQDQFVYMAKDNTDAKTYELQSSRDKADVDKDETEGLRDTSKPVFTIKKMILKDNDCGVSKTNVVKEAGLLKEIRHMHPKTYKKLLELQRSVTQNKEFFIYNLMFTATDYNETVANINDAANTLKSLCDAGQLRLDLDVDEYLETGIASQGSCSLPPIESTPKQ